MKAFLNSTLLLVTISISSLVYSQTSILETDIDEVININYTKGYEFLENGRYDSAEYYLKKTLDLQELFLGAYNVETIGNYINLASNYRRTFDIKQALNYLDIAEQRLKDSIPNSPYLGYVYNNKGNIYFDQRDFAEANNYYKHSLEFFNEISWPFDDIYSMAYFNYLRSLIQLNRFNEARNYKDLLDIQKQKVELFSEKTLMNLSSTYRMLGHYEISLELLDYSLSRLTNEKEYNQHLESSILYNKALVYIDLEEYDLALDLLKLIILESKQNDNYTLHRFIYPQLRIGTIYYKTGKYELAYHWTKKSIADITELFSKLNIDKIAKSNDPSYMDFASLYEVLAKSSSELYKYTGNIDYLVESLDSYIIINESFRTSRVGMMSEESIFFQSSNNIQLMNEGILVAIELYRKTKKISYLEIAFELNESFKASALNAQFNNIEAIQFADLPQETLEEEDRLSREISAYEELLFKEQLEEERDSVKIRNYEAILFGLKDNYNSLMNRLENEFPKYYDLKYKTTTAKISEIKQNLHKDQALAEYVLADSLITIFVVDSEQTRVVSKPIDSLFAEECIEYYRLLQSQEFDKGVHETYEKYVRLSRKFYQTLVEPVREITPRKEIIFVPDGELMYLPFETFLTEDVDDKYIDYLRLPYLIHELSIGYSYSATLLFNNPIRRDAPEDKVLAFAPAYDNLLNLDQPLVWNRQSNPHFLIPLDGAREEVKNLSSMLPAHTFMDYEATEANFKKYASDYSVLHLAMHTIMNDEEPMFSRLAFARAENDTTEDHDLFTYEIYNLNLNADMVVLSSCSSGYGKMQKGEGMMSMARGFLYAGCPTIVMTLWQVSDKSSAELMSSFYKYLRRGKTKNEALRLAKIDYIKSSDKLKSNPYFWSSFLVVGDSSPLYAKKSTGFWFLLILITVVILFAIRFRKEIVFRLTRQGF